MLEKRGQITIFIIVGIILLAIVAVFIATRESINVTPEIVRISASNLDKASVEERLKFCMQDYAERALVVYGLEGGGLSFEFNEERIELPVQIYLTENEKSVPSIQEMEEAFSNAMINVLPDCVDQAEYPGYEIVEKAKPEVRTAFGEKETFLDINYPVEMRSNSTVATIKSFRLVFPVRIKHMRDVAEELVDKIGSDPDWVDILDIGGYDIGVSIRPVNENYFIYTLTDLVDPENNGTYVYNFGVIFKVSKEAKQDNTPPNFANLQEEYVVKQGENFVLDVDASDIDNDQLYYSIDAESKLFSIEKYSGKFSFVAKAENKGSYDVRFIVDDGKGGWSEKLVSIKII